MTPFKSNFFKLEQNRFVVLVHLFLSIFGPKYIRLALPDNPVPDSSSVRNRRYMKNFSPTATY